MAQMWHPADNKGWNDHRIGLPHSYKGAEYKSKTS